MTEYTSATFARPAKDSTSELYGVAFTAYVRDFKNVDLTKAYKLKDKLHNKPRPVKPAAEDPYRRKHKKKKKDKKKKDKERKRKRKERQEKHEPIECKLCHKMCHGRRSYIKHLKGKRHQKNMQMFENDITQPLISSAVEKAEEQEKAVRKSLKETLRERDEKLGIKQELKFEEGEDVSDDSDSSSSSSSGESSDEEEDKSKPSGSRDAKPKDDDEDRENWSKIDPKEQLRKLKEKAEAYKKEKEKEEKKKEPKIQKMETPFGWDKTKEEEETLLSRAARKKKKRKEQKTNFLKQNFGWSRTEKNLMNDQAVKDMLRKYSQPICLFGEDKWDRRSRLQRLLDRRQVYKSRVKNNLYAGFVKESDEQTDSTFEVMQRIMNRPREPKGECKVCKVEIFGELQWQAHMMSARHARRAKQKAYEEMRKIECKCEICDVVCYGPSDFDLHCAGIGHQTALAEAKTGGFSIVEEVDEEEVDTDFVSFKKKNPDDDDEDGMNWQVLQVDPTVEYKLTEVPIPQNFNYPYEYAIMEYVFYDMGRHDEPNRNEEDETLSEIEEAYEGDFVKYTFEENKRGCVLCGEFEHFANKCPRKKELKLQLKKVGPCHGCQKWGHKERDCPNRICFYCSERGHMKRECPLGSHWGVIEIEYYEQIFG